MICVNSNFICMVIVALLSFVSQQLALAQESNALSSMSGSSLHGVVRDSAMKPVTGAVISLQDKNQKLAASTDAAGTYRFGVLMDGLHTLTVKKTGYVDLNIECAIAKNESKTVDLILQSQAQPPAHNGSLPEFFDEPHFTVAGVTDSTNLGGHGSSVTLARTKDALAKATASLKPAPACSSFDTTRELFLRKTLEHDPQSFDANYELAGLLIDKGKAAEALPYLETASRLEPDDYAIVFEVARAHVGTGDYQQAKSELLSLLASPDKSGQEKAKGYHLLGQVDEKLGDPLRAVREYQQAAEVIPSEANLFDWGSELLLHHAADPAVEVFTKGNRLFPNSVRMLTALGASWYATGFYEKAAEVLCQASDLDPQDPNPYVFLGKMQATEMLQSPAIAARIRRFAKLQPENALANYYYAVSLWKGRSSAEEGETLAKVKSLLMRTVELDPKLASAYLQLGILYSEQKDLRQAIAAYQQAIAAMPDFEDAHYRLAQAYSHAGEPSKAHAELKVYEQLAQEHAAETARQQHEVQEFVYQLQRTPTPAQQ